MQKLLRLMRLLFVYIIFIMVTLAIELIDVRV